MSGDPPTSIRRVLGTGALLLAAVVVGCGGDRLVNGLCPIVDPVDVTPDSVEVAVGDSAQLTVALDVKHDTLTWRSGDSTVATVNEGLLHGIAVGETVVSARVDFPADRDRCTPAVGADTADVTVTER